MDTQGMTSPIEGKEVKAKREYPPYIPKAIPVFTDMERKELKQMMREVLNEYL